MASRSSVFSICYAHCSVPHRTSTGQHVLDYSTCFSCSTSTSSLPAALLFFSASIPFLYSSSLKGCAIVGVPSLIGGSIGRFGFVGIVPWPLMSNWSATWLAFTRHGGFGVVGSGRWIAV